MFSKKNDLDCAIYAIRCKATGRIYIGSSHDKDERIRQHMSQLRNGKKTFLNQKTGLREKTAWQLDYDKFGEQDFEFYVLEPKVPYGHRRAEEKKWIDKYCAIDPRYGYNYDPMKLLAKIEWCDGTPPLPSEFPGEADTDA